MIVRHNDFLLNRVRATWLILLCCTESEKDPNSVIYMFFFSFFSSTIVSTHVTLKYTCFTIKWNYIITCWLIIFVLAARLVRCERSHFRFILPSYSVLYFTHHPDCKCFHRTAWFMQFSSPDSVFTYFSFSSVFSTFALHLAAFFKMLCK